QKQTYSLNTVAGNKRPCELNVSDKISYNIPGPVVSTALGVITGNAQALSGFKRPRLDRLLGPSINTPTVVKCNPNLEDNLDDHESYTQRKLLASTPRSSQNPLLSLSHRRYGLPRILVENLASLGIDSIYPWQSSCLLGRGLMEGHKNLVYTAPTGGGKSLVADILMLKSVLSRKKAIIVLPYVALVQEKVKWMRRAVENVQKVTEEHEIQSQWRANHDHDSIRIVGFFGGSKTRAHWSDVDVAICTIEKACDDTTIAFGQL
ncbi:hypothetical protein MMC09_004069, partial [Bachmanniomyces sp. S44760]|nr:hypothetical protein [Bachmanniomyces sp. S44760]